MDRVVVIKRDIKNNETWRYTGTVLAQEDHYITVEAYFNRPDMLFQGIYLRQGDRFVETFFTDRWFNVFAIHDYQTGQFKGLYCNISYPAIINNSEVSYIDLALDVLVFPDGRQLVLDQDEFDELPITQKVKDTAEAALREVMIYTADVLAEYT